MTTVADTLRAALGRTRSELTALVGPGPADLGLAAVLVLLTAWTVLAGLSRLGRVLFTVGTVVVHAAVGAALLYLLSALVRESAVLGEYVPTALVGWGRINPVAGEE
jgi:hypothetical protein